VGFGDELVTSFGTRFSSAPAATFEPRNKNDLYLRNKPEAVTCTWVVRDSWKFSIGVQAQG